MAVLSNIKKKMSVNLASMADNGANLIAKASELSSQQLEEIEKLRQNFLTEKPNTNPESIKKLLGSYAIEAYEAYLPQISSLYEPIPFEDKFDELNRIRYFEITKWVTDSSENSIEKLINVYQVISRDDCSIALIYNRKVEACHVYLAIVNNGEDGNPEMVDILEKRIKAAIKGNFPGSVLREGRDCNENASKGSWLECLGPENIKDCSVAAVSNIATEKAGDFLNQSMEKLLDGILPTGEKEEYTIVLLATPVKEQLERKNMLSELYSKLSPYAAWQTTYTYAEMSSEGSSAAFNLNLGVSAGRQSGQALMQGSSKTVSDSVAEGSSHTDSQTVTKTDTVGGSVTTGTGIDTPVAKGHVDVTTHYDHSKSESKGSSDTVSRMNTTTNTMGTSSSVGQNRGLNLGINFGVNFARTSNVTVTIGRNEGITQNFTNYNIKYTLDMLEKQIERLQESSAFGMWDFSAYFLSQNSEIVNNAANMYLALTQGDHSYLTQSAMNLWIPPVYTDSGNEEKVEKLKKEKKNIDYILNYIRNLQHPEFQLKQIKEDDNWLMYPPHVDLTVGLTGRELARALNFPRKSVNGLTVTECVPFGRNIYLLSDKKEDKGMIDIGNIYHMCSDEDTGVELDLQDFTMHTFITGATGSGKSNTIYALLNEILNKKMKKKISFMVIEPAKGEYKEIFGGCSDVNVYGTNAKKTPLLQINPFSFPDDIHVLEHIDRLVEIFNACWPMYAAMPAVLKDAVEKAYISVGWSLTTSECAANRFPTFFDVERELEIVLTSSKYSDDTKGDYTGALQTRLHSLTNGINGLIFCSEKEISSEKLFDENVIIDLSRVGSSETKSLMMGILVMKLQEYRMNQGDLDESLKHITVLEEAHHLLKRTSTETSQESANLQGKSVEMIGNAIAEMRTYGEGFIIADQSPALMDMSVIRNTNTKIILRLPDESDRILVGKAASLNDDQIEELAKLERGVAAIYQNDWLEAVLCKVKYFDKNEYEKFEYHLSQEKEDTPQEKLIQNMLHGKQKHMELTEEDVDYLKNWIEKQDVGRDVKKIFFKALDGQDSFSKNEKFNALYCLIKAHSLWDKYKNWGNIESFQAMVDNTIMEKLSVTRECASEIRKAAYLFAGQNIESDDEELVNDIFLYGGVK